MSAFPGFSGTLFPGRYLTDALVRDAERLGRFAGNDALEVRLASWWGRATHTCGPTTSTRTIVDELAMPLLAILGFRARSMTFNDDEADVCLETRRGTTVALIVRPWASRPSARLRHTFGFAQAIDARWCFVLAPPFLSVVSVGGHATRRAIDIALPHAVSPPISPQFVLLTRNDMFDPGEPTGRAAPLDLLVARAGQFQDRVRRDLQGGVKSALVSIRDALAGGMRRGQVLDAGDESLTVVYRILFLLFAESREVVPHANSVYSQAYAMNALCRRALAGEARGTWDGLAAMTRLARTGCHAAGLDAAAFNGPLFARRSAPVVEGGRPIARPSRRSDARDEAARRALVALGSRPGVAGLEAISYRDLGVEELGGIYEQVLDLDRKDGARRPDRGHRRQAHALARKETGTFYTPQPLADYLVRRTLGPLVASASADDILRLRVVDPAMGSGAFLVASCHYLAHAYERAQIDEGRASALDFDEDARANIRRTIAERCLAGVDRNRTAVHLARLSLWLTTLARGKPLTFLDHRLRTGDSLTGAWPEDLRRPAGRPSGASSDLPLFETSDLEHALRAIANPPRDHGQRIERHRARCSEQGSALATPIR
ncbi:MAG: N-6 DNA methylase [Acidobacteriota bacterium]